jgi:outer membrane PBP1 activator LpoA protein
MQRAPAFLVLLVLLLYFGAGTLATRGVLAQEQSDAQERAEPIPREAHISVLLPLQSPTLGRLADAVRRGVLEAHRVHAGAGLPVVILASGEDPYEITQAYERAVQQGARFIIGPLTRTAVSVVASSNLVRVSTLALNAPEGDMPLPYEMYLFGMQVESEARQLARLAAQQGRRRALVVASDSVLSKRLAEAFRTEWVQRGNQVEEEFQYTTDVSSLSKLRDMLTIGSADMVFLALDGKRAKLIRSYLGLSMAIYATSLVHTSDAPLANYELNGVFFVDMPWLLTPDHPAVLSYERPDPAQANIEYQRFYAMGIDAYRIAQDLLRTDSEFQPLDGVTGYITLDHDRRLIREGVAAQFVQGETRVLSDQPTP